MLPEHRTVNSAPRAPRLALLLLCVVLMLPSAACRKRGADEAQPTSKGKSPPVKIVYPAAPGSFVRLVGKLRSSVVHLSTNVTVRGGPGDWFPATTRQDPTATGEPGQRLRHSLGTGFIIDAEGHVLTTAHLVSRASVIWAQTVGGPRLPARVLGLDPASDVALLKVAPPPGVRLSPARQGDSDTLRVGEWVVALGNPFGHGVTVSAGVVSARERRELPPGRHGLWGFVQTDVKIHPGNSGGPLVNMQGQVVGIARALEAHAGSVGFVVPLKLALGLVPQLKQAGRVARTWVGIYVDKVTAARAKTAGLRAASGALVTSVVLQGPADRAGLRAGDIIVSFDGHEIKTAADLPRLAGLAGVNRQVQVAVWRARKQQSFTLKTEKMPQ